MPDMLVKLYELDKYPVDYKKLSKDGITIITAMSANLSKIERWITEKFNEGWANEAAKSILSSPSKCFLAVDKDGIVGFACYDSTAKGFFGPTGVDESVRGKGVGKALLLRTLGAMAEEGYAYAVIGFVGPADFYAKCCGAQLIPDSTPGYYKNLLR